MRSVKRGILIEYKLGLSRATGVDVPRPLSYRRPEAREDIVRAIHLPPLLLLRLRYAEACGSNGRRVYLPGCKELLEAASSIK
jgi:hypothetical protein